MSLFAFGFPEDEKVKKYTAAMDTALAYFDSINEWADFIAFLNKLSKVLSQFASHQFLCRKIAVSKRLSQCLNPALPAGVHSKALEVYDQIYCMVSREFLEQNIALLTCGLFSFFKFSSISVKPMLLDIYESKFILCESALRIEVMPNVMASLFSGLEEPNEFFDRVTELLWGLQEANKFEFFHQFWCILNDFEHLRLGCVNFLLKNIKKFTLKMQSVSKELDFDIVCLAAAKSLLDKDALVVRQTLDVVCALFSLCDSQSEWPLTKKQKLILLQAVLSCLLKKNFSLTRRVYNWIEGNSGESDDLGNAVALASHSIGTETHELLCCCFEEMLMHSECSNQPSSSLLAFKIMCHFLDKGNIANAVLEHVFMQFLLAAFNGFKQEKDLEKKQEFLIGVNRLFEMVDLNASWLQILVYLKAKGISSCTSLLTFTLKHTRLVEQEAKNLLIPNLFLFLVQNQCQEVEIYQLILQKLEFSKDYHHSLVETSFPSQEAFKIHTNLSFVYSNSIFWLFKFLLNEDLDFCKKGAFLCILNNMLSGATISNSCNILHDLGLGLGKELGTFPKDAKICILFLVRHRLIEIDSPQEFVCQILSNGNFRKIDQILLPVQELFPRETENFFLSAFSKRHEHIESCNRVNPTDLIQYWNAFPEVSMLFTTCILIDHVNLDDFCGEESLIFNSWILSQECNLEKILISLFQFFSSHSSLKQAICVNGKQLEYFFDKFLFLLEVRKMNLLHFLANSSIGHFHQSLPPLLQELLGTEGSLFKGICCLLAKFVELIPLPSSLVSMHHRIVQLVLLLWESSMMNASDNQDLLGVIDKIYCNLSFFNSVNTLKLLIEFISRLASCSFTLPGCQDKISKILALHHVIYFDSALLTSLIYLAFELYLNNFFEMSLWLLDSLMRSLIELPSQENYLILPLLFLFNGGSIKGIDEIASEVACFPQLSNSKKLYTFVSSIIDGFCSTFKKGNSNSPQQQSQTIPQHQPRKSILSQDFLLLFLEKAFNCNESSCLNFIFLVAFLLDNDAFTEGVLRYWSQSIYEKTSPGMENILIKINFFCSIGIVSYSKIISLSLNACLFSKKSTSTSVLINESIGLDMLLKLISHGTWKPSEIEWSNLACCLKDFFEGNRGRFTFVGCKIFHFLLAYQHMRQSNNSIWTDKKTLRDIQDAFSRLLSASCVKISKLISLAKKTSLLSGNSMGNFDENTSSNSSNLEMADFLNFCCLFVFASSKVTTQPDENGKSLTIVNPLKEIEKGAEQIITKFIGDVAIPLILLKSSLSIYGWKILVSISKTSATWIKIVKDFSIEPLLFTGKEFAGVVEESAPMKNEILSACWSGSCSTTESDRLLDWINNKLIIPLPSNVNMLFMNKEVEFASKSEAIRQITAIIFCAPRGHFISALHAILEKIVEAFRVLERCSVHMEMFLLIKILLLRFPLSSLANFFPIVCFEIYSLLATLSLPLVNFTNEFGNGEIFALVYAACQVLDLMFVVKDHEFQGYLNLFFGNDGKSGLFDKWSSSLASSEATADSTAVQAKNIRCIPTQNDEIHTHSSMKKPVLTQPLSQIKSIDQFFWPLLVNAPINAHLNAYQAQVDWNFIDELMLKEIYCSPIGGGGGGTSVSETVSE